MGFWTLLFVAVALWLIVRAVLRSVASQRYLANFRLRRVEMDASGELISGSQTVDFVEMRVFGEYTFLDYAPGVVDWPDLHELRRLDGPRWEVRPTGPYYEHHVAELQSRLDDKYVDREEVEKELAGLFSGNVPWREFSRGSETESAYQLFLRSYRPSDAEDDARYGLQTLEEVYNQRWKREADKLAEHERKKTAA
jgi:hypothetical protein